MDYVWGCFLAFFWCLPDYVSTLSYCMLQVQKYARPLTRQQLTGDSSPVVIEEYTFETERRDGRVNMSRLVIMQRLSDESYLGTLYVDRDFKDSDQKGNACRSVLVTDSSTTRQCYMSCSSVSPPSHVGFRL